MGEAKRNREETRAKLTEIAQQWMFAPSEWEAKLVAELEASPAIRARRWPHHILVEQMRMPPKECHANTRWYADHDPEKKTRQVTGWWRQADVYVLHSVIERDGKYICISPDLTGSGPEFDFIPDPRIEWRDDAAGLYREAWHNGVLLGPGLRIRPGEVIRNAEEAIARLKITKNPWDALREITLP